MLKHEIIFTLGKGKGGISEEIDFVSIPKEFLLTNFKGKEALLESPVGPVSIFPTLEVVVMATRRGGGVLMVNIQNLYHPCNGAVIFSRDYFSAENPLIGSGLRTIIKEEATGETLDDICWEILKATFFRDDASKIYFPTLRTRLDTLKDGKL